jgi:carbon-monoxide dehydrogenase small subunit
MCEAPGAGPAAPGSAASSALSVAAGLYEFVHAYRTSSCTSGMVMSAKALLDENSNPTREEVREAIQGNLCADEGYVKYIEAIEIAAKEMRGGK